MYNFTTKILTQTKCCVCVFICVYMCSCVYIYEENKGIKIIKMNTGFSRSDGENFP